MRKISVTSKKGTNFLESYLPEMSTIHILHNICVCVCINVYIRVCTHSTITVYRDYCMHASLIIGFHSILSFKYTYNKFL